MEFASGSRFDGQWARDLVNGRGVMYYTNNDKYEGEWYDGVR